MAFSPLFSESVQGVNNKLPTYEGNLDPDQVNDNMETAGGLVLARVGEVDYVPEPLTNLATQVIEIGAASLTDQQNRPEEQGANSRGATLWAQFLDLLDRLTSGIDALGGEQPISERPNFTFAAPQRYDYQQF